MADTTEAPAVETPADPVDSAASVLFPPAATETPADPPAAVETPPVEAPALTTEEQAAKDAADAAAKAEADKKAAEGAPEAYADFTLPEGQALNAEITEQFKAVAKELNLNQANAQKLVDMAAQLTQSNLVAQESQLDALAAAWRGETAKDAEIGGAKLDETKALAAVARDNFMTPALRDIFERTKLGDHPEVVRFLSKIGRAISPDSFVTSGKPTGQPKTAADVLFDHKPKA